MDPFKNNNREVEIPRRDGTKFIAKLPAWADHRAKITVREDPVQAYRLFIIIAHPDHAPMYLNERTGKWRKL